MVDTNYDILPKSFYKTENGKQELTVDKKLADAVQTGIQARLDELPPADRETFLKMTANLAPGQVDGKQKLNEVLDAYEVAAKLIGNDSDLTAYVGDIADFIARAMIKSQNRQRETALEGRFAAHQAAKADLDAQAGQSLKAADKLTSAAISAVVGATVGGVAGIAGSGASAIGSVKNIGTMSSQMAKMKGMTATISAKTNQLNEMQAGLPNVPSRADVKGIADLKSEIDQFSQLQNSSRHGFEIAQSQAQTSAAVGQVGTTSGDIGHSAGSSADAQLQADSKRADAKGSKDAAAAQLAQQIADFQKSIEDALKQMCDQIVAFIKNSQDAELQAMAAAARA